MEETSTNIHMGLVRRNKFLRENPISCKIVAVCGKTGAWRGFGRYEEATKWLRTSSEQAQ
ncbi:hypothetical protein DR64_2156 [Paraburkholderia xenovorans LB400]|nr:hypothetical protein DR64_2156 [Paraburkholderia xenovorans LB400]